MNLPSSPEPINNEVTERPTRRRHAAEYKKRILEEYEACVKGERGALLRREGLYSSHVDGWRKQRDALVQQALMPKKRGPKTAPTNALAREIAELRRKLARTERSLKEAQTIIEIQKKLSEVLGLPLHTIEDEKNEHDKSE